MSDSNNNNNNNNNSLFLYTALIFVAAIIIIIFAYFAQTHVEMSQPSVSVNGEASPYDPDAPSETASDSLQGIAKTASELSEENRVLLEENRELNKRLDELEKNQEIYEPLIEAYYCSISSNTERAALLLEDIDYEALSEEAKSLYDFILSNIQ